MYFDEKMKGLIHWDSQHKALSYLENCGLRYAFMWSNGREKNSIAEP